MKQLLKKYIQEQERHDIIAIVQTIRWTGGHDWEEEKKNQWIRQRKIL